MCVYTNISVHKHAFLHPKCLNQLKAMKLMKGLTNVIIFFIHLQRHLQ